VDNADTVIVVLFLGDPRSFEGAERGQSGGTFPDGELAVRGGDNLDLRASGGEVRNLFGEAVSNTFVHGGTAGEDDVLHEIAPGIQIGLSDGLPRQGLYGHARFSVQLRLEEKLGNHHTEGAFDFNLALIWESVGPIEFG